MTGALALPPGSSPGVVGAFSAALKAAGVPFAKRALLVAAKAVAVAGYRAGRDAPAGAREPVDVAVRCVGRRAPSRRVRPAGTRPRALARRRSPRDRPMRVRGAGSGVAPTTNTDGRRPPRSCVRRGPSLENAAPAHADGELVAVVIPALVPSSRRARAAAVAGLRATLGALAAQTRPPDLVVLVDDGSTPPLPSLDSASAPPLHQLRLERNAGPAAARNAGLAAAAGATLACFTDADCVPDDAWVAAHIAAQAAARGVASGPTRAAGGAATAAAFHDACGTLNGRVLPSGALLYGCTCNLSVALSGRKGEKASADAGYSPPASALRFDPAFRAAAFEDVDLCVRAAKAGLPLTKAPTARVSHAYASGPLALYAQFRRYGAAEGQLVAKHPEYLQQLWTSTELPA